MKVSVWIKEKDLEKMKNWMWQLDHSILNRPPEWFTHNPGNIYLNILVDYNTYIALKNAKDEE